MGHSRFTYLVRGSHISLSFHHTKKTWLVETTQILFLSGGFGSQYRYFVSVDPFFFLVVPLFHSEDGMMMPLETYNFIVVLLASNYQAWPKQKWDCFISVSFLDTETLSLRNMHIKIWLCFLTHCAQVVQEFLHEKYHRNSQTGRTKPGNLEMDNKGFPGKPFLSFWVLSRAETSTTSCHAGAAPSARGWALGAQRYDGRWLPP